MENQSEKLDHQVAGLPSLCLASSRIQSGSWKLLSLPNAPWKYSYMLGGMVSLCSLPICLRTISEYRKRSPQMRQCHWSRAKMYGHHSELFGSSLGSGILTNPVCDAPDAPLASAAI